MNGLLHEPQALTRRMQAQWHGPSPFAAVCEWASRAHSAEAPACQCRCHAAAAAVGFQEEARRGVDTGRACLDWTPICVSRTTCLPDAEQDGDEAACGLVDVRKLLPIPSDLLPTPAPSTGASLQCSGGPARVHPIPSRCEWMDGWMDGSGALPTCLCHFMPRVCVRALSGAVTGRPSTPAREPLSARPVQMCVYISNPAISLRKSIHLPIRPSNQPSMN